MSDVGHRRRRLNHNKGVPMIKYLFLDLDDTILDFKKAEAIAIRKTMRQ